MKTYFIIPIMVLIMVTCTQKEPVPVAEEPIPTAAEVTVIDAQVRKARILLDNEYFRVVRVILAPGERQEKHAGGHRVIYSMSNYTINWMENGVDLGTKIWKRGDVHYHQPDEHYIQNLGKTYADILVFNRKPTPLPESMTGIVSNIFSKAAGFVERRLENDQFTVICTTVPAGSTLPEYRMKPHVVFAMSDIELMLSPRGSEPFEINLTKGGVVWVDPGLYELRNSGTSEARFLMVAIRQ